MTMNLAQISRAPLLAAVVFLAAPLAAFADESRLTINSGSGEHSFTIELVDTPDMRAQGLMNRTRLAEDAGMLFDFFEEREVSFWMMNTLIPLDMIFIGADGVIKTVHVNAQPLDTTSIPSQVPVQFVLEIPGGRSRELGIQPGDTVEHPRMPPVE